jgi:hypothetical protein
MFSREKIAYRVQKKACTKMHDGVEYVILDQVYPLLNADVWLAVRFDLEAPVREQTRSQAWVQTTAQTNDQIRKLSKGKPGKLPTKE